jgi:tRNA(Ile)-lysidine synthase
LFGLLHTNYLKKNCTNEVLCAKIKHNLFKIKFLDKKNHFKYYFCSMKNKILTFINKENLLKRGVKVIVACSGGADSIFLLHILDLLGFECIVAHCNFHLRGEESNRDENFVRKFCDKRNLTLIVKSFATTEYAQENKLSIEMAARELRYNWFEEVRQEYNAGTIAVAHHSDDSIETILLNLLRGTGLKGICGIRPKNGNVVRPLLCVNRKEIEEYLHKQDIEYITDSTNLENEYTRNKIRNIVMPILREINPQIDTVMLSNAENFSSAEHIYRYFIEKEKSSAISITDDCYIVDLKVVEKFAEPFTLLYECLKDFSFHPATIKTMLTAEGNTTFKTGKHVARKEKGKIIVKEL